MKSCQRLSSILVCYYLCGTEKSRSKQLPRLTMLFQEDVFVVRKRVKRQEVL